MTSQAAIRQCFEAVTSQAAQILNLADYGVVPGARAVVVLLDAGDVVEALRLRAVRRYVIRAGKVVAQTAQPLRTSLNLPGAQCRGEF